MSKPTFINSSVVYNDHSTEYNIDARGNKDVNALIRACNAVDVEPAKEEAAGKDIPIPEEGNYNAVREYIEERKKYDKVFMQYCKSHSRKKVCEFLSIEFGWDVDEHSLGANINRH